MWTKRRHLLRGLAGQRQFGSRGGFVYALNDAIDFRLGNTRRLFVRSLKDSYLHLSIIGIEAEFDLVRTHVRIAILKSLVVWALDIENPALRRI